MNKVKIISLSGVISILVVMTVHACQIPVYQFALENWPPDCYNVFVFHQKPLSKKEEALIKYLDQLSQDETQPLNIFPEIINLAESEDKALKDLWHQQITRHPESKLPYFLVCRPGCYEWKEVIWGAPLSKKNIKKLHLSPVRKKIAREILKGKSILWLVVKSGKRKEDRKVERLLKEELKKLEKTIELPDPSQYDYYPEEEEEKEEEEKEQKPLRPQFSILSLPGVVKKEEILLNILFRNKDLQEDRPAVFPIFGRGRVLPPLIKEEITAEEIESICYFLTGPCSCQVKTALPGVDLLMGANWQGRAKEKENIFNKVWVKIKITPRLKKQLLAVFLGSLFGLLGGTAFLLIKKPKIKR